MQQRCSRRVWGHAGLTHAHTRTHSGLCVCVCVGRSPPPSFHLEVADDGDVCAAEERSPVCLIHPLVVFLTTLQGGRVFPCLPGLRGVPPESLSKQSRNAGGRRGGGSLAEQRVGCWEVDSIGSMESKPEAGRTLRVCKRPIQSCVEDPNRWLVSFGEAVGLFVRNKEHTHPNQLEKLRQSERCSFHFIVTINSVKRAAKLGSFSS